MSCKRRWCWALFGVMLVLTFRRIEAGDALWAAIDGALACFWFLQASDPTT